MTVYLFLIVKSVALPPMFLRSSTVLGAISVRRRKNQAVNQYEDDLCKYQDGFYKSCIFDSLGRDRGNRYWQIEPA